MRTPPSLTRTHTDQFVPGHPGGQDNPHAGQVAAVRVALFRAATPDEVHKVVTNLIDLCHSADPNVAVRATALLLDRLLGKARETVDVDVTAARPPQPLPDLSPEEVAVLSRVIGRSA